MRTFVSIRICRGLDPSGGAYEAKKAARVSAAFQSEISCRSATILRRTWFEVESDEGALTLIQRTQNDLDRKELDRLNRA